MGFLDTIKRIFTRSSCVAETIKYNRAKINGEAKFTPVVVVKAIKNRAILSEFLSGSNTDQVESLKFMHAKAFDVVMIALHLRNGKRIGIKLDLKLLSLYETIAGIFITKKLVVMEDGDPADHKYILDLEDATAHMDDVWQNSLKEDMVVNCLLPQLKNHSPNNNWTKLKVLELLKSNPNEINVFEQKCKDYWNDTL